MLNESFMQDIEKVEQEMQKTTEAQDKIAQSIANVEMEKGIGITLNIEEADLDKVQEQQNAMDQNVAELIQGLDSVTKQLGSEFDTMQELTGMEKLINIFSSDKATSMRSDRIKSTSIDQKLQDLISQSNRIVEILKTQKANLEKEYNTVNASFEKTNDLRLEKVAELDKLKAELETLQPKVEELEEKIVMTSDQSERTQLESELQKLNIQFNDTQNQYQVVLAESQSLEKYAKMYETFSNSLQNQKSTQEVLINKLEIDTKERVVIYQATAESLRTAAQQDVAHKINDIGNAVDNEVAKTAAYIGSAANNRMVGMIEEHATNMENLEIIKRSKEKADMKFNERFAKVVEKHETANYKY